ncbi:MAG TPA: prepilin-type N-terminal cleavage/methylation domain-containing protein [bacterium]|jgi:prepilin-type N-terminal cleavage/methylation domain-containing protein|nr:prepilin-type N-terminal cleavage/methylation domain-containing protein [bacterium]
MKSGFTLIELLISLVVFSLVIPIVYQVSEGVVFSTTAASVTNELKLINQKLIQSIKTDVVQSAVVFDRTSGYTLYLNLPPNYTSLNKNKLPVINETGSFPPESDKVGNILFMAKYLSPVEITVNGTNYRIDCYRFIYYFLAKDTGSTINGKNPIILMRSQSQETYVDYSASKQKDLVKALYNTGIRHAIDLKNTNFYALNSNGNINSENNHTVQMESNPASRDFGANQLPTGKVYYAIGYNNMGLIDIPKFANADNSGDGFPNGFEVAIVGPKSSRDILVRTVVIGYFSGKVLGNENTTIISVPQF